MPETHRKNLPTGFPPPDVPIDQTKGEINYGSGGAGLGLVWLWRKARGLFSAHRSHG